jgi:hypothetical protein
MDMAFGTGITIEFLLLEMKSSAGQDGVLFK